MTNFFAARMPTGPGGDEFVGLLNKLNSRHRVSTDIEKLTNFMRSDPDSPETRSPRGILAFEKERGVQRLAAGRDSSFHLNSIGKEPFGNQGTPSFLQIHAVGGSAVIPKCALLSQEPGALNAVDILLGTAPGFSPNVMWSSGDTSMDSVVKKEEPEEEYRPLFTLNPPPQQKTYPLFRNVDALVKEEVDEGHQNSGAIEDLVKEECVDDDEFGDSGDHEENFGEKLAEEANQGLPDDLNTAFIFKGHLYKCRLCDDHCSVAFLMKHWHLHPLCQYCQKRFSTQELLSIHRRIHIVCHVCGETFSTDSNLMIHMRVHKGEKPYACEKCEKAFSTRWLLKQHTRLHAGEKPYVCEICEKTFYIRSHLKEHMRLHTGEKPFECEVCQKRFNKKHSLTIHFRMHTGEKPFECTECQKRFTQKGHLDCHRLHIHGIEKQ